MLLQLPSSGYMSAKVGAHIVEGKFPPRALRHVFEWRELHQAELMNDWELCRQSQMPHPIQPLE
ncbi:DUF4160 domain-containing protein [Zoogloea oleivorans]|nr:DUF4160 domain-containing protein [Zoogloea oleivorans]